MPTVSVIIPTHNRAAMLGGAIESILAQAYQDWELLIVDDGSRDHTPEVVRAAAARDARIRSLWQLSSGASAARNRGIRACRVELVAFLDDDDRWAPEKLTRQVQHLRVHPEHGWVYSFMTMLDQASGTTTPHGRVITTFKELFRGYFIGPPSVMVRRTCFDRVGLFRESIRYCEDTEFFLRLAKTFRFGCIEQPLVIRTFHEENGSVERQAAYLESLVFMYRSLDLRGQTDVTWLDRIRKVAGLHDYAARFYLEQGDAWQAARHIGLSLLTYPAIGLYRSTGPLDGWRWLREAWSPVAELGRCVAAGCRGRAPVSAER